MSDSGRSYLDARVRASLDAGDVAQAGTLALRALGPELAGFCRAITRDPALADEAFAATCVDVWRGLPGFRGDAPLRVWAHAVARRACLRTRRDVQARSGRVVGGDSAFEAIAAELRSETAPYLRTTIKDGVARLRERLEPDEQALLTLRIDRELDWLDVARVLAGPDVVLDDVEARRASASCRKRFERVKLQLRAWAREEGLLESG